MRRECRERFPRHRLRRIKEKRQLAIPTCITARAWRTAGTCVTHVPCCMSGTLTRCGGENVPGITGACVTLNFTYLVRGPWKGVSLRKLYLGTVNNTASTIICRMLQKHNGRNSYHTAIWTTTYLGPFPMAVWQQVLCAVTRCFIFVRRHHEYCI